MNALKNELEIFESSLNDTGEKLRKSLLRDDKIRVRDAKENYKWMKKTLRRIEKLIKSKPSTIYIWDDHVLEEGASYVDIHIAFPNFFGKLQSRWVCTLLSNEAYRLDNKMTLENGGEYIIPEKQCNFQKFDDLYVNIEDFKTEDDIVKHFVEWRDLFIPELSNAEIKYEYKGK